MEAEGHGGVAEARATAKVVVVKDVFVLLDRLITLDLQSDAIAAHAIQQVEDMLSSVASGSSSEEFIRLQTFDKKILTAARQSASSVGFEDRELRDETQGPYIHADEVDSDCVAIDVTLVPDIQTLVAEVSARRCTDSDDDAAAAARQSSPEFIQPRRADRGTPATTASDVVRGAKDAVDIKDVRLIDCKLDRKFSLHMTPECSHKAMRNHPLGGSHSQCSGLLSTEFHRCASMLYDRDLPMPENAMKMCQLLEKLLESFVVLFRRNNGPQVTLTEDTLQEVHERALRVVCAMLSPDFTVYDIRKRPFLVLEEGNTYFTGYGNVLVTLRYDVESRKRIEVAVCVNELKKDTLTYSNGIGQTAGQVLHFNGRHSRSYKLETILDLPVHFCSGVLSNAGAAVGLTLIQDRGVLDQGSDKRKAIFVLEVAERTPLQCIATMLMRSLELRNIVLKKSDSVGTVRVVRVVLAEDDGKADDSGGGGVDQQTEDPLEPGARCAGADETGEDEYEIREDDDDDGIMLELQTLPPPLALKLIDQSAVDRFIDSGAMGTW